MTPTEPDAEIHEEPARRMGWHDTEDEEAIRASITEALINEHYRRAKARIAASPEEHCAALATAVMAALRPHLGAIDAMWSRAEQAEAAIERVRRAITALLSAQEAMLQGWAEAAAPGHHLCACQQELWRLLHERADDLRAALDDSVGLELRQFQAEEIARLFGVPPSLLRTGHVKGNS